jgi:hypothetical protein
MMHTLWSVDGGEGVSDLQLIVQHGLVEFCLKHLMPGFAEDDLVLEIIIMLGTLAADPQAAPMLANHRLIHCLHDVLLEKSDDDEVVLQIVFTLFKFLLHRETREVIMQNEDTYLVHLESTNIHVVGVHRPQPWRTVCPFSHAIFTVWLQVMVIISCNVNGVVWLIVVVVQNTFGRGHARVIAGIEPCHSAHG